MTTKTPKFMLTIDLAAWSVDVSGEKIDLTMREFSLLSFLAAHPGIAYRRSELVRQAWTSRTSITERSVDLYVSRLRSKLGYAGFDIIKTVQGIGYRLDPSIGGLSSVVVVTKPDDAAS